MDSTRAYDSTTHCTSAIVASRLAWSAGRATFTTVPSMNVMPEPMIVTVSTHGTARLGQGPREARAWITPSSQGGFSAAVIRNPRLDRALECCAIGGRMSNDTATSILYSAIAAISG